MPQPRKSPPARNGGTRRKATEQPPESAPEEDSRAGAGLRDQLSRALVPLDAVLLTRERLQEIVDDAVSRGRMTRSDATDLMTEILSLGRRTTEDLLSDLDQRLGSPAERVRREVDRARRATGLASSAVPITGYEGMTAAQVQARLGELTPADLRRVRDYERRNANRKTVLAAIESRLG